MLEYKAEDSTAAAAATATAGATTASTYGCHEFTYYREREFHPTVQLGGRFVARQLDAQFYRRHYHLDASPAAAAFAACARYGREAGNVDAAG